MPLAVRTKHFFHERTWNTCWITTPKLEKVWNIHVKLRLSTRLFIFRHIKRTPHDGKQQENLWLSVQVSFKETPDCTSVCTVNRVRKLHILNVRDITRLRDKSAGKCVLYLSFYEHRYIFYGANFTDFVKLTHFGSLIIHFSLEVKECIGWRGHIWNQRKSKRRRH